MVSLGIDIGTSSCKVIAVAPDGSIIARASGEYPLSSAQQGYSEQAPEDWWRVTDQCVREVTMFLPEKGAEVAAIGLSGQMHGLVALDEAGEVIRPAILWNDQRCTEECDSITDELGGIDEVVKATNNRLITGFTAGKVRWLKDHEPQSFALLSRVLNPKDFLRLRMTGKYVTDVSDASGTGLYDVAGRKWSAPMLEAAGIHESLMPKVVESNEPTGYLSADIASAWNVSRDVMVYGGGGDAVIQTLSMGITQPGDIGITLGTAGIVAAVTNFCPENTKGRVQVSCYNRPGYWHIMGVSLTAAGALQWLTDTLQDLDPDKDVAFSRLIELAKQVPAGSDGLLFMPYLAGERSPTYAPTATASWVGLTRMHRLGHLVRSVIEGALLNMREVLENFKDMGVACDRIIVSGGATKEPFWLQTLADIFGQEVIMLTGSAEGGAYGAAITAGIGAGAWTSYEAVFENLNVDQKYVPDAEKHELYSRLFEAHRHVFADSEQMFENIRIARDRVAL